MKIKAGTLIKRGKHTDVYIGNFDSSYGEKHALVFDGKNQCAVVFRIGNDSYREYAKGMMLLIENSYGHFFLICQRENNEKKYFVCNVREYIDRFLSLAKDQRIKWYYDHYIIDIIESDHIKKARSMMERKYDVKIENLFSFQFDSKNRRDDIGIY